jgi:hypothetical protein
MSETPFDSVESAHHYVALLVEAIADARRDIEADMELAVSAGTTRQVEALRLVEHKLSQLAAHMHSSSRLLNDLGLLRRLLLGQSDES